MWRSILEPPLSSSDPQIPDDEDEFSDALANSLQAWQTLELKGIWLPLPVTKAKLLPIALEAGFEVHHGHKKSIMLTKWLPNTPNYLPDYPHTNIGVGGFVIDDKGKVLAISEKWGNYKGMKMPGGCVDRGEDLMDAAVREVFEETGVKTKAEGIIAVRHFHKFRFGSDDLYFIVHLTPITTEINKCPREINECKWMDFEEFAKFTYQRSPLFQRDGLGKWNGVVYKGAYLYRPGDVALSKNTDTVWAHLVKGRSLMEFP